MSAASDMSAWRRQNSNPVLVEIQLTNGKMMRGTILVQREKMLKDILSSPDLFLEFECSVSGEMVLAKSSIDMVHPFKQVSADQLDKQLKLLEKSEAFSVLKVSKTADRAAIRSAYLALQRIYHPDRYAGIELPAEVTEYLNAATRRINAAYSELIALMGPEAAAA